jgi:tripartite ATP-independent transporter DctM subunit
MMSDAAAVYTLMALLLVLVIGGAHLGFVLMALAICFGLAYMGPTFFSMAMLSFFGTMESEELIAVPLFVFMGCILEKSEVAENVFQTIYEVFGAVRGGLAYATIATCTIFAACTGVIAATVVTMTLLAVPAMMKRKYSKSLATGVVCAGGSLGILIPPSVMLVMYGPMANLSVAKLFAAAFFPGLVLSGLYIAYIAAASWIVPTLAPAIPQEEMPPRDRHFWLRVTWKMLPTVLLIVAVLGSIIAGVASPTEASGLGAFCALILTASYRKMNLAVLKGAAYTTLTVTSMVFFIIIGANIFNAVFLFMGGGEMIKSMLLGLPFGRWFILGVMMFVLFIGGFFISWQGLLYIVVPTFLPVATVLQFDQLWFALLVCVNLQMSFLTPPFAYAIFFVKGSAPPEIKTKDIYWGVVPFVLMQVVGLTLCIIYPEIIIWLPRVTLGGGH